MKNQDYVLIGRGKPGVLAMGGDSHHPSPPLFAPNMAFWINKELFANMQQFEKPLEQEIADLGPEAANALRAEVHQIMSSAQQTQEGLVEAHNKIKDSAMGKLIAAKVKLNKTGSMLWQFNGLYAPNPYKVKGDAQYIRSIAVMGEPGLVEWNWFDYYVKRPITILRARWLNFLAIKFVYKNWEPGQWPIPWAAKGQFPIHESMFNPKADADLSKTISDLEKLVNDKDKPETKN